MIHRILRPFATARLTATLAVAFASTTLVGCYSAEELGLVTAEPSDKGQLGSDEFKMSWTERDDPALFSTNLEYSLSALPQSAELEQAPWAGNYWPVYKDSINDRWAGPSSQSPAEKYGAAFSVDNIADRVSSHYGIDHQSSRTECTTNSQCDSTIGESCSKRDGADSGYCIPTWWGICHAWGPASILEPEPIHAVTQNGVTFQPNDIKALVTLAWNRSTSKFVSLRCNENAEAGDIDYDGYNRPTGSDAECIDTNPGTYHVLLANYLGIKGESFVEDRTIDDEVWNQPLRGYRITQQTEVTPQRANELVGVPEGDEPGSTPQSRNLEFSGSVQSNQWFHQPSIPVSAGEEVVVTMTGSGDADLYLAFNHEPSPSNWVCRPWLNGSTESCRAVAPSNASSARVSVHGYGSNNSFDVKVEVSEHPGGGEVATDYRFNDEAAKLFHVRLEVDYIAESPAGLDGNLAHRIDDFTHTDRYQYILEVDANDKIIGGEWVGTSQQNHPDFLWLPTGRGTEPIAGGAITYAHVQELLESSLAGPAEPTGGPSTEIATVREDGSLARRAWAQFGPFEAVAGSFRAEMTGTGDADLYVRRGSAPTTSHYDCRPYTSGSNETCALDGEGSYYVGVRGYSASTYDLTVTYTTEVEGGLPGGDNTPTEPTGPEHIDLSGSVAHGDWVHATIDLSAGDTILIRTQAENDVDLYVRWGSAPTLTAYDHRPYKASGNESVLFTAQQAGTLHVAVQGYAASSYRLWTEDPE